MSVIKAVASSSVERVYEELRELAIRFDMLPGERINEVELAARLNVSRTPLREALNRLTADGFLDSRPGKGFYRRALEVNEIVDLYELRLQLEIAGTGLAIQRATPAQIDPIRAFIDVSRREDPERGLYELVQLDETFHLMLAGLSGNEALVDTLRRINARIRFVRWVAMENDRRRQTQAEHAQILEAVAARDGARAYELLHAHIECRREQITAAIREGYAMIYMRDSRA
ncbi:GntR family transcriptional regulator [Paenirhodobacter populi]|uniref:GntR family transcriptional regulator n=1 Tax=Paenirhodobacter populi TaxID=2306993 RepID=A0A443J8Y5_9RHOB|nr:GntR family transcriptional regulator [Sinirhodobacter populi]RWR16937.1 GntR family transcriptional regulator [Sinirhodobacter populi]